MKMEVHSDNQKSHVEVVQEMADDGDLTPWRESVNYLLERWGGTKPEYKPETKEQIEELLSKFDKMHKVDQEKYAHELSRVILKLVDWGSILSKSLEHDALIAIASHEVTVKALEILQKDKEVDPSHAYSHKEGDENNPRFYYQDTAGNLVRYTNAPSGHADNHNQLGDPSIHRHEPLFEGNPEYFTPEGRKLTRCPECAPENVEWNPTYNAHDPQNAWAGRWVDPESGEHRYTYIDTDIRNMPQTQLHQQNAITDQRLPELRAAAKEMFSSDRLKDQITAIALMLLDQGKMRATELSSLSVSDVHIQGNTINFGKRQVLVGPKILSAVQTLVTRKSPQEPLFSIPVQETDGEVNPELSRRIGPNYLSAVLDYVGLSLIGLQTYHCTLRFAQEVHKYLSDHLASWDQAVQYAVLSAMLEWGHDFRYEQDTAGVLQLAQAVLIDPVIVNYLRSKAEEAGIANQPPQPSIPPAMITLPYVTVDSVDKTQEELEFSQWLHSAPVHEYV